MGLFRDTEEIYEVYAALFDLSREGFSLLQILKVFYYNNRLFENIPVRRHCKRNRKEMSFKDGMVDDDCRVLRSK